MAYTILYLPPLLVWLTGLRLTPLISERLKYVEISISFHVETKAISSRDVINYDIRKFKEHLYEISR